MLKSLSIVTLHTELAASRLNLSHLIQVINVLFVIVSCLLIILAAPNFKLASCLILNWVSAARLPPNFKPDLKWACRQPESLTHSDCAEGISSAPHQITHCVHRTRSFFLSVLTLFQSSVWRQCQTVTLPRSMTVNLLTWAYRQPPTASSPASER